MDESAALRWMRDGGTLAIDVFADEPTPHPGLIRHAALATPHIAGHTAWAKAEGVRRCLVWLAEHHHAELASDAVGVAPCEHDAYRALWEANERLKRGEPFKEVRSSSVRLRLPGRAISNRASQ